jgi:hypothetical protein
MGSFFGCSRRFTRSRAVTHSDFESLGLTLPRTRTRSSLAVVSLGLVCKVGLLACARAPHPRPIRRTPRPRPPGPKPLSDAWSRARTSRCGGHASTRGARGRVQRVLSCAWRWQVMASETRPPPSSRRCTSRRRSSLGRRVARGDREARRDAEGLDGPFAAGVRRLDARFTAPLAAGDWLVALARGDREMKFLARPRGKAVRVHESGLDRVDPGRRPQSPKRSRFARMCST